MKRLTTLLMTLLLISGALWAEETVTVSAKSTDISEGLDLKVVAKLFAEAKNLEEFEMMLNNPDSAFCNLDLNGDGQVDYLRVVETGEGNKRLIVLQAVLAQDIYQDVASIYVEKKENNEVSVQVVGDEYVYGSNYIIEPVYVYRPVIYDWFWSDAWLAWYSPWYWGFWPSWWYMHACWAHDRYWHHCYAFHHHHHNCSFRHGHSIHNGYHDLHKEVSHREYAQSHPDRTFTARNSGKTNARELQDRGVSRRQSVSNGSHVSSATRAATATATATRTATTTRTSAAPVNSSAATRTATATLTATTTPTRTSAAPANTAATTRTVSTSRSATSTRSYSAPATSGSYGSSRSSGYSGGSTTRTPSYSGGATTRSSGGFSGGSGPRTGGGGSRGSRR